MSIQDKKRLVIKVGSALIAPANYGCSTKYLYNIAQFINRSRAQGQEVVLVSSGSVAAGKQWVDADKPSKALKKAMAAAGQTEMMAVWDKLLGFPVAQILLTHADLCNTERYKSIKETIESLLSHGVLPIINENDTVASDELKVGDNDNLSAMAATAVDADALIMCTDVDGLYNKNPQTNSDAVLLSEVKEIDESIFNMAGGAVSTMGTGGMRTKIEAAHKATSHGIDTYIINGFTAQSFNKLLKDENPGTHFLPKTNPMSPTVHWMTHTVKEKGEIVIDDDLTDINHSNGMFNSENILSVKGQFSVGDTILVSNDKSKKVVKAKANYSSCLLNYIVQEKRNNTTQTPRLKKSSIISTEHLAVMENS